jgi:Rod binding domain-containing protein
MDSKSIMAGSYNASNPMLGELTRQTQAPNLKASQGSAEVEGKFTEFVAGTFYKTMLASLRKTAKNDNPLIHGGRAEEIFRAQLDQTLAERLAVSHGRQMSGKMYEQFSRTQSDAASSAGNNGGAVGQVPFTPPGRLG